MGDVAIVGTGQTVHARRRLDVSQAGLAREAVTNALEDANLTFADIDSVVIASGQLPVDERGQAAQRLEHVGRHIVAGEFSGDFTWKSGVMKGKLAGNPLCPDRAYSFEFRQVR